MIDKNMKIVNTYINTLSIFNIRSYKLINGLFKENIVSDGKTLLSNITEYHWIHESKHEKLHVLASTQNTCIYFKISFSYQNIPRLKIVLAESYDDLAKNVLSNRNYRKYMREIN